MRHQSSPDLLELAQSLCQRRSSPAEVAAQNLWLRRRRSRYGGKFFVLWRTYDKLTQLKVFLKRKVGQPAWT